MEVSEALKELLRKYIGKRFCIFKGENRGNIGKCKWIEARTLSALGETKTFYWYRIEVGFNDGGRYPTYRSFWASEDQIIRIQDEPDEVPYYSGW